MNNYFTVRTILCEFSTALFLILILFHNSYGQIRNLPPSQQFRLGDRIVRIAEPGQLSDTLNVWGDINSPGRYLVPKNTSLPKLISYALGPINFRDRQTALDWSKIRVEINVSSYNPTQGYENVKRFQFRYSEPVPVEMRTFDLKNNQIVSVEVKRKPAFIDYVQVIAPVVSTVATSILLIQRLN